jgi:ribosomal-protein-alanine N-acetyltransferase
MAAPAIHEIGPAGAELVAALMAATVEPAWSAESVAQLLAGPGCAALVAEGAEGPVGFALVRVAAGEAELLSLGVLEAARRHGLGRALVGAAAAQARAAGAATLHLEVAEDNAPARGLYRALGFRPAGRRPGYYAAPGGGRRDALLLALALDPA